MSSSLEHPVRSFLERESVGGVVTLRKDGKARQTIVYYVLDGDRILMSTEALRGKARDVERSGWASFCVLGHAKPWPSCTVEGSARILRQGIGGATARILEKITGNRPEPPPSDEQLAAAGRVILAIDIERVYGVSYLS